MTEYEIGVMCSDTYKLREYAKEMQNLGFYGMKEVFNNVPDIIALYKTSSKVPETEIKDKIIQVFGDSFSQLNISPKRNALDRLITPVPEHG